MTLVELLETNLVTVSDGPKKGMIIRGWGRTARRRRFSRLTVAGRHCRDHGGPIKNFAQRNHDGCLLSWNHKAYTGWQPNKSISEFGWVRSREASWNI